MIRTNRLRGAAFLAGVATLAFSAPLFAQESQRNGSENIDALLEAPSDRASSAEMQASETPTMSFGKWGVDPTLLSPTIEPGDDFFGYVNGEWLDANPLPDQYSRFGAFTLLSEKSTTDVKALIDDLGAKDPATLSADEARIMAVYNAYLDTAAINAAGLAPARPYIDALAQASTLDELAMLWAKPGYPSPLSGYVSVDAKQPDRYVAYFGSGGLGLPDRDYYLDETEKGREIQSKYRDYMAMLFEAAGYEDPANAALAVYAFEDRIAREISWDRGVSRNRDLTYNALTMAEIEALAGDYPIAETLAATGLDASPIFVVSAMPPTDEEIAELGLTPETLAKIGKGLPGFMDLLNDTPLATLQAWSIKEFLSDNSDVLPEQFDAASFEFYGKTLRGTPEQRPRWKRAISATEGALGELVGKAYVERYFPKESKVAMDELVANLRLAVADSIEEIEWMGARNQDTGARKACHFRSEDRLPRKSRNLSRP